MLIPKFEMIPLNPKYWLASTERAVLIGIIPKGYYLKEKDIKDIFLRTGLEVQHRLSRFDILTQSSITSYDKHLLMFKFVDNERWYIMPSEEGHY